MTRINLVPPAELMDQHLMAEFREIKMVPQALKRSLIATGERQVRSLDSGKRTVVNNRTIKAEVLLSIPLTFTLNTGHVKFFYDKGKYLHDRYSQIYDELRKRGFKVNADTGLDNENVYALLSTDFYKDFVPSAEDLALIRARIAEKIALRPGWYRYYGEVK